MRSFVIPLVAAIACGAGDPRAELLERAAASAPGPRRQAILACTYDALAERHGIETALRLVEMTRAEARGTPMPSGARAVLALSLQEAARCARTSRGARP